ncbi:hypothetical protein P4O66_002770 [Electrophorus voltai]|uniref:Uncharacterized protein n=1 Tax=Electrophorus voltai TaxID=2609070 RepID=A0AAD8YVI2_9TELE|nr:hypothetical protein P4O66_002770 [Electrophorus voltai]
MNNSGVRTEGPDAVCATPKNMAGKSILDVANACSFKKPALPVTSDPVTSTTAVITPTSTAFTRGQRTTYVESNTAANHNISNKDFLAAGSRNGQQEPVVSNTWKFLAGVVLIALCTSMFIICAIKSPSWYKLLFDYRHQRLHELDEPSNTGRYFNFSLDTEQTETSAQELDQDPKALSPEDEDGFIEDGYIQAENYKDHDDIDEI